jgi:hypothetical protein
MTRNRPPTAAQRLAHDVRMAELFPTTAGKRSDMFPCRACGVRGEALVPPHITEHGTAGYCAACERKAWDRAAHQNAFPLDYD